MTIGKMLASARKKKNLTQTEVAQYFGWGNAQFVSNIERGIANPPVEMARAYARKVGVDPDRLVTAMVNNYKKRF